MKEIDSFIFILQELEDDEQYIGKQELISQECAHMPSERDTESYSCVGNGIVAHHETAICFKALFQKAAFRLCGECLYPFKSKTGVSQGTLRAELWF